MTVGDLLETLAPLMADGAPRPPDPATCEIGGIAYDSRAVRAGDAFVALKGQHQDGASFARDALAAGALVVVSESPPAVDAPVPWLVVTDARRALAELSAAFHGHPSRELLVVGITGTNGKTTTSYLVSEVFDAAGVRCGRLGTVSYRLGDQERPAPRTTPEAPDLQRLLREMVDAGCRACAMEVSSHALSLERVEAMRFGAAVFTNLTRDHLDFHGDMESYFRAKRHLFDLLSDRGVSVINIDDPRGRDLAREVPRAVTYAAERPADVMPGPLNASLTGLAFDVQTSRGTLRVESPLVGHFNVYNLLAAAAVGVALDLPFSAIERGLGAVRAVPGRFEVVSHRTDDVTVVVDYAHTDDALKNLLETARPLARNRLITVFGCGGDRDRTKRPLMGAVAARISDVVIVTSDNPRSEDPAQIIEEIRRGIPAGGSPAQARRAPACMAIVDRREAIERAIRTAEAGDLVVVAGKGHEKYQEIGGKVHPFDDVEVARTALGRRRSGSRA